jgi:hypothetical protein
VQVATAGVPGSPRCEGASGPYAVSASPRLSRVRRSEWASYAKEVAFPDSPLVERHMNRGEARRASRRSPWWLSAGLLLLAGCIVDEDNACGENQTEEKGKYRGCICVENTVPTADGRACQACGMNEVPANGMCSCAVGYRRPAVGMPCAMIVDSGMSGNDSGAAAGPTGQDSPCTTQADCAAFDATLCQDLQAPKICLVQGCASGGSTCSSGRDCCVFPSFVPTLGSAGGVCLPTGSCASPGMVMQ